MSCIEEDVINQIENYHRKANYSYEEKKIKVTIKNPLNGSTLKLRIGKRKYTKKIKSNNKTVSIKIKKPAAGNKIVGKLYYKGKLVGDGEYTSQIVYYSRKLKKGMSKKRAQQVPKWEYPYKKSVYGKSETWEYMEYDEDGYATDYKYLYFYRGRLKGWSY